MIVANDELETASPTEDFDVVSTALRARCTIRGLWKIESAEGSR